MKISNLKKLYWPDEHISKGEMIEYYRKVAKTLLRYTRNRPLALHRFPNGIKEEGFYQKDMRNAPGFVQIAQIIHSNRKVHYVLGQNMNTLLYLANLGSIEMHVFNSRVENLDRPDYMVLDLDPESVSFDTVIDVALVFHEILQNLKIAHFPKTSGGSGMHIYIPLKQKYSFEQARSYALKIAKLAHERLPKATSLERDPKKRKRKVYLDTQQNVKGALMAAPYSLRAFPKAPVSTPLSWDEVKHGLKPEDFTIKNVAARIQKKGDLFKDVLGKGANLSVMD